MAYVPIRDLIAETLLATVQTEAEDDGCGTITPTFIEHAAQDVYDALINHGASL